MAIYVSTSMYHSNNFKNILYFVERYNGKVGVEIFPRFDEPEFEKVLKECLPALKRVPVNFHEPYFEIEHTAGFNTKQYKITMHRLSSMIKYGSILGCEYIVCHHNNCAVSDENREKLLKVSQDNMYEVSQLLLPYGIKAAVENSGTVAKNTMLLNESNFIKLCKESVSDVVIDLGHINTNGWDLKNVICSLQDKIVSYHIHNNYGKIDEHNSIFDGTLDFNKFAEYYREFTPTANIVIEYNEGFADKEDEICRDIDYVFEAVKCCEKALA